jgi:acyl-CoA hydrolase
VVHVTEADVTMVAVDDEMKPVPILHPEGTKR